MAWLADNELKPAATVSSVLPWTRRPGRDEVTLAQIRKHALALPGVTEEPHFDRTSFRVGGRIFATARAREAHIHVFVPEQPREQALALYPEFISKLLWGGKVVGVRIELPHAEAGAVKDLIRTAWQARTPAGARKG